MTKVSDTDLDRMAYNEEDKQAPFCPEGCGKHMKWDKHDKEWYCTECDGVDYGG